MVRYSPGDTVRCHIKDNAIVSIYEEHWDYSSNFDIISICEEGYILHILKDVVIKESFEITKQNYQRLCTSKKFIDCTGCYVNDYKVVALVRKLDGMCCGKCQDFFPMAAANQPDMHTFICWRCTRYPTYS